MTQVEKQELEALKKMLETDGWRIFHREHAQRVKDLRLTSWDSIKTLEQLHYLRGFIEALESIVNYDRLLEAQEAQIQDT